MKEERKTGKGDEEKARNMERGDVTSTRDTCATTCCVRKRLIAWMNRVCKDSLMADHTPFCNCRGYFLLTNRKPAGCRGLEAR